MGGRTDYAVGRSGLDKAAGIHNCDAIGDLYRNPNVVGHEYDRHTQLLLQLTQQHDYLHLHCNIERGGRLVSQ